MSGLDPSKFHTADYVVLSITLVVSAGIGIYFRFTGGKQKTTKEYLLGNKNQKIIPVAISLMASFMSAITLLGVSAEIYNYGTLFLIINFAYVIFTPIAAYLYLPVFFKLGATSAYEYLERRFGIITRTVASLIYTLYMTLYMGIVLYAPAIALEALTGLSQNQSILVVGLVCTFYSTIGGIKAVIVTDVFQSLLMFTAIFCVIYGAVSEKGFDGIWKIAEEKGRIEFVNLNPDPTIRHTYFSLLIGGGLTYLSLYAINQTQVQRYLTMKDYKTAVKSLWLSLPILIILSFSTGFSGLAIFSKYYSCDPLLEGRISRSDQMMPLFIVESVNSFPGLAGLFVAGIFSASLSTVSACLNSLSAVTLEDYIKPVYLRCSNKTFPDAKSIFLSKFLALMYGVICLSIAFLARYLGGILQAALTIFGVVGGPLLGVFTLGMFIPAANEIGAVTGVLSGLVFSLYLGFGGSKPIPQKLWLSIDGCYGNLTSSPVYTTIPPFEGDFPYLFRISYMYYIVLGFLLTMVIGIIISFLASACGRVQDDCDPDLFIPPVAKYLRKHRNKLNMVRYIYIYIHNCTC
uniref:Sodium-dependent multivitamin transporter n=1 Tax=Clastoptera arizonana TaxID=38151 RepID=A0A1B6CD99_9HEMI